MTISASSVIANVQRILNDEAGVRVPASQLVPFLNQAQRDIMVTRPDTTATVAPFSLIAGAKQFLPTNAYLLIDIPSNSTGTQRAITKVPQNLLDASRPGWRNDTQAAEIAHFTHDLRDPRIFWVFPPAVVGTQVELEASVYPTDIADPASPGLEASTVSGNISINDEWQTALFSIVAHYAYLTDLEGVTNPALAAGHLQRAAAILGVQLQAASAVTPQN